jgi:hypothetical protein
MKNKSIILIVLLSFISAPSILRAQSIAQDFFLDSWMPKNIEITTFDPMVQTTQAATVTVTVDAAITIAKVSKYVYGHNAAAWGGKLEQSTQCVKDLTALQPNIIRWPGGSMSDQYFWKATSSTTCPKDLPSTFPFGDLLYGSNNTSWTMSLDSYYSLLAKTNSTGIITVNYGYARVGTSADPVLAAAKYAADWVRYDNSRTRYWEIGNEDFGNWEYGYTIDQTLNKDGQPKTITGDLYGKHCKVFIDEMRKAAKEVGNDIKIGVVAMDSYVSYDAVQMNWNSGMMKQVGNIADFIIVHSYHTPYNENSTVSTILNSNTKSKEIMTYVNNGLKTAINHNPLPMALTEWNIFAIGSKQGVSYINGLHASLVLGELIKNGYGQSTRWDLVNGWDNGDNHALLADGEPGIARYTPRAPFFNMYYFQKYFGDKMIKSTVSGSTDVICYASKFSSGQSSVVLVNKGTTEKVISIKLDNFSKGTRYYYYLLTGGTDNGDFSRKVYVNGKTTISEGGGPADYATIKPFGTDISGEITVSLPKWGNLFLLVENDKNLQSQAIDFNSLPAKYVGDADFQITATASSGLPVQFSSSNPNVAKVVNNTIQIIGVGSCDIVASQDGNTIYNPAVQVAQTLTVTKGNQTISFSGLQPKTTVDPPFSPGAIASSGLVCTYTSSNAGVAVIVNGEIQIRGAGSSIITAKQSGNINFNAATDVSQTITVGSGSQTINFGALSNKTYGDAPFILTATATSELTVTYSSSNTAVATVSGSTLTIVGVGSTNITASQAGNVNYNVATDVQQTLTVGKASQSIYFDALANKIYGDANFNLTAISNSGLTVSYASSNTAVATVTSSTVTIIGAGSTTINASQVGNNNYIAAADVPQELTVTFRTLSETIRIGNDFEIFPNPATDVVTIKFYGSESGFVICNAVGQTVYSQSKSVSEITIPTKRVGSPGIYFVRSNSTTKKLILTK